MTQPNTINGTFDTSLIDVAAEKHQAQPQCPPHCQSQYHNTNTSFSTTASDPSEPDQQAKPSQTIQHIPTREAYDQWASVYDSDGNMLQAIDNHVLSVFLPELLNMVLSLNAQKKNGNTIDIIDLGCGTGRTLLNLLSLDWPEDRTTRLLGLDFSQKMLDVAKLKLEDKLEKTDKRDIVLRLECCNCFPTVLDSAASPVPPVPDLSVPVDAVVSTLVLEHVPLRDYFLTLRELVVDGGYALVTNMHSEMGRMSQAGFVNEEGVKIRGTSFVYTMDETVEEAEKAGFAMVRFKERGVEVEDVERGLVGERGRKWVGVKVWYGLLLRRVG